MKAIQTMKAVLVAVAAMVFGTVWATDGTMKSTSGAWNDTTTWKDGAVPGGAGAAIKLAEQATALYFLTNDVTIGSLAYPAENTKQSVAFTLDNSWYGARIATDEYPSNEGYAYGYPKMGTVTFEGANATFANDNPENIHSSPNSSYLAILHPTVLKSNLAVRGIGRKDSNIVVQPAWAMGLLGRVTEADGKHGLTVNVGTATKFTDPFAIYDSSNDFTGDIDVQRGNLRAVSIDSLEHDDSTVFGHDNAIYATNGQSSVDIADNRFGKTQHLYIGGAAPSTTCGTLFSTYSDANYVPEWKGKVTLTSDAVIGGYPNTGSGYSNNRGNLCISGDIDDGGNGYSLTVRGVWQRPVHLTGKNTYSGGTIIDGLSAYSGGILLEADKDSLGSGPVTFKNNGALIYRGPQSCDVSTQGFSGQPRFYVPDGVTYNPAATLGNFSGLFKFGKGSLVLARENKSATSQLQIYDGELVLDYAEDVGYRYNSSQNCNLNGDVALRVRNIPDEAYTLIGHYFGMGEASYIRFFNDSSSDMRQFSVNRLTPANGSIAIIETPDKFSCGIGNGGTTATNPGFIAPTIFYKNETWVARGSSITYKKDKTTFSAWETLPFADFADSWTSETVTYPVVDIKAETETAPENAVASCVRFNDPSATTLTLSGETTLAGGTILVTPNVGKATVRITGGSLKTSASTTPLYIVNFNTNATVIVESPITSPGAVCAVGPGKVVLAGANTFLGTLYANNCELELRGQSPVGTTAAANGEKILGFGPNATMVFANTMTLAQTVGTGYSKISVKVGTSGAHFVVPNEDDVVTVTPLTSNWGTIACFHYYPEGKITFEGPGTFDWNISGKVPLEYCVTEGATIKTFSLGSFMHDNAGPMSLTLSDGATLKNGAFLQANGTFMSTADGVDARGKLPLRFAGDVTIDVDGLKSITMAARVEKLGRYSHILDAWIGTGTVSIVDSKATTGASIAPGGFRSTRFSGKLVSDVPFKGVGGMELPDVEFVAKKGIEHWFQAWSENESVTFGALSGEGSLICRINAFNQNLNAGSSGAVWRDQQVRIGRDKADEETAFGGYLDFGQHNNPARYDVKLYYDQFKYRGGPRLVKVGTNALKLSCPTNWMPRAPTVRGGKLLVGGDSIPTNYRAILGLGNVLVGDEETRATDTPELLVDGAYTVANDVNVPSISPAAAMPGVGGNATCEYTGTVKLFRKTALVANGADSVVTFDKIVGATGEDATQRAGIVVKGEGKIVAKSLEGVDDFGAIGNKAKLTVEGELVIPEDATFTYVPTSGETTERQAVIEATKITGSFKTVTGLPDGWTLKVSGNRVTVGYSRPVMMIVR